jgi:hypothetical protein
MVAEQLASDDGEPDELPPPPQTTEMYPVDIVDAYVRNAEATIARLQDELANARCRAASAVAALTGSLPPDGTQDHAAQDKERPGDGTAPAHAAKGDPLDGFLDSLHKRD